jgi:hypothetical protein
MVGVSVKLSVLKPSVPGMHNFMETPTMNK